MSDAQDWLERAKSSYGGNTPGATAAALISIASNLNTVVLGLQAGLELMANEDGDPEELALLFNIRKVLGIEELVTPEVLALLRLTPPVKDGESSDDL